LFCDNTPEVACKLIEEDEEELPGIPAIWLTVYQCNFTISLIFISKTLNKIQKAK
jgi:hypothetical protein